MSMHLNESHENDFLSDIRILAEAIINSDFTDYDQYLLMDLVFERGIPLRKPSLLLYPYLVGDKLFSLSSYPFVHKIFGSKPIQNPKTLILSVKAFTYLAKAGMPQYQQMAVNVARRLIFLSVTPQQDFRYVESPFKHWYDFKRNLYYSKSSPNIYVTALCGQALLLLSEIDETFLKPAIEIGNFLLSPQCYVLKNDRYFYKYFVDENPVLVHNANTAVGSFLVQLSTYVPNGARFYDVGQSALRSTFSEIREDGTLCYFATVDERYSPRMIDNFHTGFVICDLIEAFERVPDKTYLAYIKKLLGFYSTMFDHNGCPSHTPWKRFPIDIHDCAVGILTFSKASCLSNQFLSEARQIYECTKSLLRDDDGLYFYQRYPWARHKGKFLRWNQAWMLLALSTFISYSSCASTENLQENYFPMFDGANMNKCQSKIKCNSNW